MEAPRDHQGRHEGEAALEAGARIVNDTSALQDDPGLAAVVAYLLKWHYSVAGPAELSWILAPTAWLVGLGLLQAGWLARKGPRR